MTQLELREVNSYYDQSHVLFDVSLDVEDGQVITLIGRNGAGKTTTLKTIMGVLHPKSGEVVFGGEDITSMAPNDIAHRGISYVPEGRGIFPQLTVEENLKLGLIGKKQFRSLFHGNIVIDEGTLKNIFSMFPRLEERRKQEATTMSGGEQQMLAIARGLVSDPDLLLIDEPSEGLMPSLVSDLEDIIGELNRQGITILLVEQNVELAMSVSDYGYVLSEGKIQSEGSITDLLNDTEVKEKYLQV